MKTGFTVHRIAFVIQSRSIYSIVMVKHIYKIRIAVIIVCTIIKYCARYTVCVFLENSRFDFSFTGLYRFVSFSRASDRL